jgi:RNA polymerase sigma-70 factor (ECF subfamily)
LSVDRFADALARSAARRFRPAALDAVPSAELAAYLESLHVADLALAAACAAGSDAAWDEFMRAHRPALYAAARAVAGEAAGRELADLLYADLYGVTERDGRRRPLFDYFHGRSRLATWLRAVLAQRHVDRVRAARRTESLDEDREDAAPGARLASLASADPPPEPDRPRLARLFDEAVAAAVAALAPADRLRLSYYYLHDLTLARIGRLMGEHESSASRKLERARRALRADIETRLHEHGLRPDDVRALVEQAAAEGRMNLDLLEPENPRTRTREPEPRTPEPPEPTVRTSG